ncbi:tRNA adenosine(34) deaminase TadA [Varibaculum cambriense]|uniref:tRNA adenosine(34) deaminase TadA n=1 Tax=Varibaculum cambriense TaxID=184870 RepID=UPI002151DE21|nr:tRNA adenosine(34) deaminase TadA [Varibaculum cambriense]WIK88876.1 tRNA adenosine(34) deaminase TadA [Varibaculum cambriense]
MDRFDEVMRCAMDLATHAQQQSDVPVGALLLAPRIETATPISFWNTDSSASKEALALAGEGAPAPESDSPSYLGDWEIIGQGFNQRETYPFDPTAHAEIMALRQGAQHLGTWRLTGTTLVVNLEPCTMCAGALVNARVSRVVFGAWDDKAGAAGSVRDVLRDSRLNHRIEVIGGILEEECSAQLKDFFARRR